ncbi:hypothetical protein HUW62_25360 [Myxococcus sp. AM011]|uniref:hypothetical protein n=1 Tax=Myxococcus sp. AM011 TaxID=2745200 RepID=UPI00159548C0|nr:hypothetical protein [Myxococcus sp. AM011]NVJ24559.1 hypothetical protein [Myxococcus sp. AM011]
MSRAARTPRLLAAVLALVLGVGCPAPIPEECLMGGGSSVEPPSLLVPVNQPASLLIPASANSACGDMGAERPESVTVEAQDPYNLPVPATVELGPTSWTATVHFTPTMPGRYHLIVAFSPVGSLRQFDVFVAEDGRQRSTVTRMTNKPDCPFLARTHGGTWVCGGRAWRESSEPEQSIGQGRNPATAVAGDVVWSMFEGQVRRYVDPGTGPLVLTGTAPFPPSTTTDNTPHARLATEDEYVVLDATTVYRYTFSEGVGVLPVPTSQWAEQPGMTFGADSAQVLALRAGATLWLVSRVQERVTFVPRTWACPFQLGPLDTYVPVTGQPCTSLEGEPQGFGDGVLWTRGTLTSTQGFSNILHRYTVTAEHGPREEGVLSLDSSLSFHQPELRYGPTLPVLTPVSSTGPRATPRWDSERGEVLLVLVPGGGANTTVTRISDHFTWTVNHDVIPELRIYPWTSTP